MALNGAPLRLAIVGCGQVVEEGHAPALRECDGVTVVGLADLSEERVARIDALLGDDPDRGRCGDLETLLATCAPEVVLLATPPGDRLADIETLAAAGVHVLAEKPLAATAADARAACAACADHGVALVMSHNYATFPEIERLCELRGEVGTVRTVVLHGLGSAPWNGVPAYRPGWRYDAALSGGGRLMDAGIHGLYLAEMVFGSRPTSVYATARWAPEGAPIDVQCSVHLNFADGWATLEIGEGHGGCAFEVSGDDGRLSLRYDGTAGFYAEPPSELHLYRDGRLVHREAVPRRGMVTPSLYTWLGTQLTSGGYLHSGRHGADLVATANAIYRSAQEHRELALV
jgi:predicted dehydrogenase